MPRLTLIAAKSSDAAAVPPAREGEVPFGFDEIFFSRTDGRGIIRAGNSVFRRVSGYDPAQLIGAPHRIVRHPVMPKAVFQLLWDRLKDGRATGAYVCNRASDGRAYWVFAIVVPIPDGYLSVRIKPGSESFAQARLLYADLLDAEARGLSPSEGAAELRRRLAKAGFPSYESFQAQALAAEAAHRAGSIGRPQPDHAPAIRAALAADGIESELGSMRRIFREAVRIALNLRIHASQLGHLGRALSAIADNYALLCNTMAVWIDHRMAETADFNDLVRSASASLFLMNATALLDEMSDTFAGDRETGLGDPEAERAQLAGVAADYRARAGACRMRAAGDAVTLESHLVEMRHHVTGLDAIRMLCRVESNRQGRTDGTLDQIVNQLDRFQQELALCLSRTMSLGREVRILATAP